MMGMSSRTFEIMAEMHERSRDKALAEGKEDRAAFHEEARLENLETQKRWEASPYEVEQRQKAAIQRQAEIAPAAKEPPPPDDDCDDDESEEYDELEEYIDIIHPDDFLEDCGYLYSLFVEDDDSDAWFAWVPKPTNLELDDWAENHYGEDERPKKKDLLKQYYLVKYHGDIWHRVTIFQITGQSGRSIFLAAQTGEYGMDITSTAHPSMASLEKWYSDRGWYDRIY
jgi:hypothetical protein